ncbi:MAG: alpha/beta fold hydrolase [Pseudomonadota bacterium]
MKKTAPRASRLLTLLLLAALLAACGEDPVLPPARALAAPAEQIDQLYGVLPGYHEVVSERGLVLPETEDRRAIELSVFYPAAGKRYPLLIFAHGNWSSKDDYDRVLEHWVSHGYAVVAPNFLDCCSMASGIFNALRYGQYAMISTRIDAINAVLDAMPEIEALSSGFSGKGDLSRLGMTGHSFGAFTAQQYGGAAAYDEDQGAYVDAFDARVKAIVGLSPPGPMFDTITASSWDNLRLPNLHTTGTWDVQKGFWDSYEYHLMAFNEGAKGEQTSLVVEGADHYFGNLICRLEREAEPQRDALKLVNGISVAFLDAHLKKSAEARQYLASDTINEVTDRFAILARR